ncbi:uncharacterized protein LOC110852013 [Folsomia candida]|nr:uncharacterized protein LOC110852013 [Folsomia candida]
MSQCTNKLLMIRPVRFGFNPETAIDNAFQQLDDSVTPKDVQKKALEEFDTFVNKLKECGVSVHVVQDTLNPHTPDSIFPNNWISFHDDFTICIYPMAAKTRRLERKSCVLQYIEQVFQVKTVLDLSRYEQFGKFLEGTGSMVLDRTHRIAYASISERTDEELFEKFCKLMGFKPVTFHSEDEFGKAIYHTNVMMCIADKYAIVCLEALKDPSEREMLRKELEDSGKVVISLVYKQMNNFGGNMLQVKVKGGNNLCVMSTKAYESLDFEQIAKIEKFDTILHSDLTTIEANGGGSARCMIAEIFLPLNT